MACDLTRLRELAERAGSDWCISAFEAADIVLEIGRILSPSNILALIRIAEAAKDLLRELHNREMNADSATRFVAAGREFEAALAALETNPAAIVPARPAEGK